MKEMTNTELQGLMLWPRSLDLMSCSGSTSPSGGQRQQRLLREAQKTERKYENRDEVGPNTAKPVSFELGGRMGTQTIALLQEMTTKLAEVRRGELNVVMVVRRLLLIFECVFE